LVVTGSTSPNFGLNATGTYTLVVTATNPYGTSSTQTTYTIVNAVPTPTIFIDDPDPNQVFEHTVGTPALNIGFFFTATTTPGFTISDVSATLDGAPVSIDTIAGLGSVSATGTDSLAAVPTGTHTLRAYGVSAGLPSQAQ